MNNVFALRKTRWVCGNCLGKGDWCDEFYIEDNVEGDQVAICAVCDLPQKNLKVRWEKEE